MVLTWHRGHKPRQKQTVGAAYEKTTPMELLPSLLAFSFLFTFFILSSDSRRKPDG